MKKIVIVTNSISGGGAERSMNIIGSHLNKINYDVSLIAINRSNPDEFAPNCPTYSLDRKTDSGVAGTTRALFDFFKLINKLEPDLVVLNCDLPEFFGMLLPRRFELLVIEHNPKPFENRFVLGFLIRNILLFKKITWVAVSEHLRIWPYRKRPQLTLLNPIDFDLISINDKEVDCEIKRIVFIGRLVNPQKRPEIAIQIASELNLTVDFYGSGPLESTLADIASKMKVDARFHGYVSEVWSKLNSNDLLIIPSNYEGDGLVLLEAIARDVVFLVSDIPDFRRFDLPDINYCRNLSDYISTINKYRNNVESLRIPIALRRKLLDNRSIKNVTESWINLLNRIG